MHQTSLLEFAAGVACVAETDAARCEGRAFTDCAPHAETGSSGSLAAPGEPGREVRSGRRAVHADAAARVRAHRAKKARIDYSDKPEIKATLVEIADQLGCSVNEVVQSIMRFGLTNRNWKQVGLYGSKGLQ